MLFPCQPQEGAHGPAVLRTDLLSLLVFLVAQAHSWYRGQAGSPTAAGRDWLSANCMPWTLFTRSSELTLFKPVASPCAATALLSVFFFYRQEVGTCPLIGGGGGVSKRRAGFPVPSPAVSMALHPHPTTAEHPGLSGDK